VTRTYQTKAAFENGSSSQMLLGSTILGRFVFKPQGDLQIPAPALTMLEKTPAVWLVDPSTQSVALRPVEIAQYTTDKIVLTKGLHPGDRVVTAGVQSLREGQKVRAMEESHEIR
jgi:multidrug efflux pump subunit AcrA (membrane-fusion protein)